ncbi:MAG TPA: hypothetical protein VM842_03830 [Nitrospira sp.]|nr:hypothetical protein [Nitrospira sp.]
MKLVLRDAFIVYGLTFAFAVGAAVGGLNMQDHPYSAYSTNLLSGAIGFAIAANRASSHRIEHAAWVAVTFWTINLTNIAFGLQTYAAWVHSAVTIVVMALIGNTFCEVLSFLAKPLRSQTESRNTAS